MLVARACAFTVLAFGVSAVAAPVTIPNPSFESAAGYWAATDWTNAGVGSDLVVEIQNLPLMGKVGNNFLNLAVTGSNGVAPLSKHAVFSAPLGTFEANTQYTLTVGIAHTFDWHTNDTMQAYIGLATDDALGSLVQMSQWSLRNDGTAGDFVSYNQFTDKVFTYTTGAAGGPIGQNLHAVLQFSHDGEYYRSVRFDNVRLDAVAVPEPTFAGGVMAASTLLVVRRRNKR